MARVNREPKTSFFLSIVSFHEQVLGAHAYVNKARKTQGIVRGYELMELILESFRCFPALPFDDAAADVYDSLRTQKIRIGTMDLRIAAIAIAKQCTLLSRNTSDFGRVPGLMIADWTRPP
jgi:tRNA(fMet)-specific endonuclease VapC